MDEGRAADIVDHLLAAAYELDEARAAAALVADEDKDAASLGELIIKLNNELLQALFERFPDLLPFEEFPAISSSLGWEDVLLPPSVSEKDIDQIIFSVMKPRWQKVALVVCFAIEQCEALNLEVTGEIFAARIQALVEADRLENQGDVRKWRHSEVRLKGAVLRLAKSDS